jgi:hypothetical protein
VVIDGPSAAIQSLAGISVARDGTGGLVYVRQVGGVAHVFVSRVLSSGFRRPEQVDAGLPGPSSQPVIAAGNGGLLVVGFINSGTLYVNDRASAGAAGSGPIPLAGGASNPALQMTNLGKAYLAFTAGGAGGHDVRAAYYYRGNWALESVPLDANAADDAGTGAGRPDVAAAGDGVGIVVWGENGHVYSRRVWGTSPSVVDEQADGVAPPGCGELSADQPVIGSGGDSSYAAVAFREMVGCGGPTRSRVLMRRLRGSRYEGLVQADGLSGATGEGADQPQVAIGEYGRGLVTSERTGSHQLFALSAGTNDAPGGVFQLDSLPNASAPYAFPAAFGTTPELVAWQRDPGGGVPEIRVRFSPPGGVLGPELVLSNSGMGATDAADGLAASGASNGDAVVGWIQGPPGARAIVIRELLQPPGSFGPTQRLRYVRTRRPVLTWSAVRQRLASVRYFVSVDGRRVAQTRSTSVRVPVALGSGSHSWRVTAVNAAGLTSAAPAARVFVDTVAPVASVRLPNAAKAGSPVGISVRYSDRPRGRASGVATVRVRWGDGSSSRIRGGGSHVYRRRGRYRVTVAVTDRAGNSTRVVRQVIAG